MEDLLKRKLETKIKLNQAQQELKEEGNGFGDLQAFKKVKKIREELEIINIEIEKRRI